MVKTSVLRVFIPGVDGGVMASPDFGRSLSQPTEGILCPPNSAGTPGFSDLPTPYGPGIIEVLFMTKTLCLGNPRAPRAMGYIVFCH